MEDIKKNTGDESQEPTIYLGTAVSVIQALEETTRPFDETLDPLDDENFALAEELTQARFKQLGRKALDLPESYDI